MVQRATASPGGRSPHFVQFYESDATVVEAVADFIAPALRAGDAGIVIATEDHRRALDQALHTRGIDVAAAKSAGWFTTLDAQETMACFMVDGSPDPTRFQEVVGGLISRATATGHPVHAYGEMVALLTEAGQGDAAIELEELWNDLQQFHPFTLFCGYPIRLMDGTAASSLHSRVCDTHSMVIPTESFMSLMGDDERLRAIALLQQKARSLEEEVARRSAAEARLEATLAAEREARQAAEDAVRLREEFLAVASHELRTPLTSLLGETQLAMRRLARQVIDRRSSDQSLRVIHTQGLKLARLLEQLLDVSRLDGGQLRIQRERVDLAALVDRVVSDARARNDRHAIVATVPESLDAVVDPIRLEQVVVNLLENAAKYSPENAPVELSLRVPEPGTIELSVRDHGFGIPVEKRDHVFERFYQAHRDGHRSGMGIGLYVSREIVHLHGGEITLDFPDDGGTRATVRLPLDSSA